MTQAPPKTLIAPATLARLRSLELIARAVVDGLLRGLHATDRPGFSQEFAEYRDYLPGDDLRFVDWNAYARSDRLFLKLFEGETNTRLLLLLDASASMDCSVEPESPSKLRCAVWLAAALTHLAGRQHDAVGLITFDHEVRDYLAPRPGAGHAQAVYHRLDGLRAAGGSNWRGAFEAAAQRMPGRGVIVAISDFYCDPADFGSALRTLGARGQDVILFHVLSRAELAPRAVLGRRARTLRDVETGRTLNVDDAYLGGLGGGYPQRLREHVQALGREAAGAGADYVRVDAQRPPGEALAHYLRRRARRP